MEIIEQSFEIVSFPENLFELIEIAGRTCYKSEDRIDENSALGFIRSLITRGHESVLEHASVTVRFITNRGVTHELVRHRLCAYCQESTRYVNYNNRGMEFIRPVWWDNWSEEKRRVWSDSVAQAEQAYIRLMEMHTPAQEAREILPNSLKTEIVVTANIREWRHIFRVRCSKNSHPQMRSLMRECLKDFQTRFPVLFVDVNYEE